MAKKNLCRQNLRVSINKTIGYTEPTLHFGKQTYVDFYVYDPASDSMKRVKRHFDKIRPKRAQKEAMMLYAREIGAKLSGGWNPLMEYGNRGLFLLDDIMKKYNDSLLQYSRKKTMQSYTSHLNILSEYLETLPTPPKYVYQFDSVLCVNFLDWLLLHRDVSARTYNNYRGWLSGLGDWLVSRKYIKENPVSGIRKLKAEEKSRRALTSDELKMVKNHLKACDPDFYFAVMFAYYTLIRPTELSHLRIRDISIKSMSVYVSGTFSKNGRDEAVAINKPLVMEMLERGIFNYPDDYYLFGKNFKPSAERLGPDRFNKRWVIMRKALKLDESLKFYSLKDSGIRDLAQKEGIVTARDQARHTDISTTNRYLMGRDRKGPERARTFEGDL